MAAEARLDLAGGKDDEPKPKGEQKGRERGDRKGEEPAGARTRRRHESEIRGRLTAVLDTIAETLDARGDEELADAIREDGKAIVSGLVSITRPIAWARPVILSGLGVVEPVLAFGRIGRILGTRWADRRAERRAAQAEAQAAEPDWSSLPEHELAAYADAGYPQAIAERDRRAASSTIG